MVQDMKATQAKGTKAKGELGAQFGNQFNMSIDHIQGTVLLEQKSVSARRPRKAKVIFHCRATVQSAAIQALVQ